MVGLALQDYRMPLRALSLAARGLYTECLFLAFCVPGHGPILHLSVYAIAKLSGSSTRTVKKILGDLEAARLLTYDGSVLDMMPDGA